MKNNSFESIEDFFSIKTLFISGHTFEETKKDILRASYALKKYPKKSLLLIKDKDPYRFFVWSFACMNARLIPCFYNWYWSKSQENSVHQSNTYTDILDHLELPQNDSFDTWSLDKSSQLVIYTSGSTRLKACVLTLENLFWNALGSQSVIPFSKSDIWGLCLPHFHVGGYSILIRALLAGAQVESVDLKNSSHITHLSVVPTQLERLSKNPFPKLKHCLVGGARTDMDLIQKRYQEFPLHISYGLTEMGSQVATSRIVKDPNQIVFEILPHRDVKIMDGCVAVSGPCLFLGYLENNTICDATTDGYFLTSDLAELNPHLVLKGRKDRIFQCGGENISCDWLENEIQSISKKLNLSIESLTVRSEPHTQYGQVPVADIQSSHDTEELLNLINSHLKGFYKLHKIYSQDTTTWKQRK